MASFKDNTGREWTIKLDAPLIRECRQRCEIDLADPEGRAFEKLATDVCLLVDTLWLLCKDQATGQTIDERQFAGLITGDALEAAADAILGAIADFFPKRRAELYRKVAQTAKSVQSLAIDAAMEKIDDPKLAEQMAAKIKADIDENLRRLTPSNSATNSPVSLELRPTG